MATDRFPIWGAPLPQEPKQLPSPPPESCEQFPSPWESRPVQSLSYPNPQRLFEQLISTAKHRLSIYEIFFGTERKYPDFLTKLQNLRSSCLNQETLDRLHNLTTEMGKSLDPLEVGVKEGMEGSLTFYFASGMRTATEIPIECDPKFQQLFNLITLYVRKNTPTDQKLLKDFCWFAQRTPAQINQALGLLYAEIDLTEPLSPEAVRFIQQALDYVEMRLPPLERRTDLIMLERPLSFEFFQLHEILEKLNRLPEINSLAPNHLFELRETLLTEAWTAFKILEKFNFPELDIMKLETHLRLLHSKDIPDFHAINLLIEFLRSAIQKIFNPKSSMSLSLLTPIAPQILWVRRIHLADSRFRDLHGRFNSSDLSLTDWMLGFMAETADLMSYLRETRYPNLEVLELEYGRLSSNTESLENFATYLEFVQNVMNDILGQEDSQPPSSSPSSSFAAERETPTHISFDPPNFESATRALFQEYRVYEHHIYPNIRNNTLLQESANILRLEANRLMAHLERFQYPPRLFLQRQLDELNLNNLNTIERCNDLITFIRTTYRDLIDNFRDPPSGSGSASSGSTGAGEPPPPSGRSPLLRRESIEFGMNVGMMTLLLITQEELERNRFLTPNQVNLLNLGLLGSTALVHPYTVGMTAIGLLPFQVGKEGVILLANATGVEAVEEGKFLNRALGTFAGVATSAAVAFSPAGKQAAMILQDRSLQASVNLANRIEDFVFANYTALKTGLSMYADYFKISYLQPVIAGYSAARVFVSNPLPYITPILKVASKMGGLLLILPLPKNGNFSLVESDGEDTKI